MNAKSIAKEQHKNAVFVFLIICLLIKPFSSFSQSLANYSITRTTGISYTSIMSTGNSFATWRFSGGLQQDDNRSAFTDIGFDFWYNGTRYTQFSVSTNGFIDFSSSTANGQGTGAYGYQNTAFTSTTGSLLTVAPIYDDQTTQGGGDPLGNSIKYQVDGASPNRILTVEWDNMAVYGNTTPSLNYQVKVYETTGVIEFLYETMTNGTAAFSYSCGINAATIGAPPTAAQLLTQQTANTATFNNTAQNGLTTLPANNSKITFTPLTPTAASGTLSFTAITSTGMTVNWTNWASNEVGYVIYNSTDNITFTFVAQTAVNATSRAVTGLSPSTLYYWRVYAVTEGALSAAVSASQSTSAGGDKVSNVASGNWNTAGSWTPVGVPNAGDNVTILNGHTITIDVNASCNMLTVGQGTSGILRIGNNNTARTITIGGNILINAGGTFDVNTASNTTHLLSTPANITNNGTLNFATDANSLCNVTFNKNGNQTIGGTGATNTFNLITLNMGLSASNTLEVSSSNFSAAAAGFLTLTNGTFKLSTTNVVSVTPFSVAADIPLKGGLWINSTNATVSTGASLNLYGNIKISSGNLNIGNAANENLSSNGGFFTIEGGTTTIAGRYDRPNNTLLSNFSMSAGTLIVGGTGSTTAGQAPFMMDVPGSSFTQSNGTIIIRRSGAGNLGFLVTGATSNSVTGGTLQIGDASTPAGQTIQINSSIPAYNLTINNTNSPTCQLVTNDLTVSQHVTVGSGATLNANSRNISVGGDWINNGGTHTPGTNTTTFNASGAQSITKTTGETFSSLLIAGSGTKTLGGAITVSGNLSITSGLDISASNYQINLAGNWVNNGTFTQGSGTVVLNRVGAQTISGTSTTSFNNLSLSTGALVTVSSAQNLVGVLTLNGTSTFNANGLLTLISNSLGTASIATLGTPANFTGNVTVQRYVGVRGDHYVTSPITNGTIASWNDDIEFEGFPGSNYPSSTFVNPVSYTETSATSNFAEGWTSPSNITDALTPGKGFDIWFYDNFVPLTLDVTGPINKGNISLPVTYSNNSPDGTYGDNWNLTGNPYPSTIDWDAATGWTRTNITGNTFYCWNDATQNYAAYPAGGPGTNGGTRYIASSQGFFVQASAASPVLNLTENVKVNQSNPTFWKNKEESTPPPAILFHVINAAATYNYSDDLIIRFIENSSWGRDEADAKKVFSWNESTPVIHSLADDTFAVCVNTLPSQYNVSAPIVLKNRLSIETTFKIATSFLNDISPLSCLVLEDTSNHQLYFINTSDTLSITIAPNTTKAFILKINPITANFTIAKDSAQQDSLVRFSNISTSANTFSWSFGDGSVSDEDNPSHTYNLPGEYIIKLISGSTTLNCSDSVSKQITILPNISNKIIDRENVQLTSDCNEKACFFNLKNDNEKIYSAHIYSALGSLVFSISKINANNFEFPIYTCKPGVYFVNLIGSFGRINRKIFIY